MSQFGTTNGQVLGHDGIRFKQERVDMLYACVHSRIKLLVEGRIENDPIKVFIKQEPHKVAKLRENRFRIISAVSLVDTMIDRILFGWVMDGVLSNTLKTPTAIGWVPLNGGHKIFRKRFGKRTMCCDKSAWDWTVQYWLVDAWEQVLQRLCFAPEWWRRAARFRFVSLFREAVFRFSDGSTIRQEGTGIMKSGCYLTLFLNSLGQSMLHYVVQHYRGLDPLENEPTSMGDDTVQNSFESEEYESIMSMLGPVLKVEHFKEGTVEFAGFYIDELKSWPVYWKKHVWQLAHLNPAVADETLDCYQLLYAHEPNMLALIHQEMWRRCPHLVREKDELCLFFDGYHKLAARSGN